MEIKLKTITPLHIGNGEELHALDYVEHNGKFYRISQNKFFQFLQTCGIEEIKQFSQWAIETADLIDNIDEYAKSENDRNRKTDFNQQLTALKKNFNYLVFTAKINKKAEFIRFLEKEVTGIPILGDGGRSKTQVRGLLKTGDGKAYLPGTSLKGVIRTALMYHVLENHTSAVLVQDLLDKSIKNVRFEVAEADRSRKKPDLEKLKKGFCDQLEEVVFYCQMINEDGKTKSGEEQYDLMKFLLVGDSLPETQSLAIENMDMYLVSKIKDRRTGKMLLETAKQSQAPSVETMASGLDFTIRVDFDINFLLNFKKLLAGNNSIKNQNGEHWINATEKIKKLYNLDIALLTAENAATLKLEVIQHILQCVAIFSRNQLEYTKKWLNKIKENDAKNIYSSKIEDGFKNLTRLSYHTLFNIGYASGFAGTTEMLYLLRHAKSQMQEMMELFRIGDNPQAHKKRKPGETFVAKPDDFPKSKRLVSRNDIILPLGWMVYANEGSVEIAVNTQHNVVTKPTGPRYPKGTIKQGLEIDAEVVHCGSPNRVKLFLSETNQPIKDLKYGAGFSPDKLGQMIRVRVSAVKGKDEIVSLQFVNF
jgi:CRISPR type III-A-associated RAMP protein Csm5